MFPRKTYPDFGSLAGAIPTPGMDVTEIPGRIGSPVTLRRSGKVYWYDMFDDLNAWVTYKTGVNSSVDISATGMFGSGACLIKPGDAIDDFAYISLLIPSLLGHTIGLECNYWALGGTTEFQIQGIDALITSTPSPIAKINQVWWAKQINYYYSGAWHQYAETGLITSPYGWANIKLCVDFQKRKYKYLAYNDVELHPDNALPVITGEVGKYINIIIKHTRDGLEIPAQLGIDFVIITIDEY